MPEEKDPKKANTAQILDVEPAPIEEVAPPAETAAAAAQRDPDTGRFVATKHTHSRRLTQMALDLGLAQQTIDETPTEHLDDLVYHLNSKVIALHEQFRRETPREYPRQAAAPALPTPEPEPEIDPEVHPSIAAELMRLREKTRKLDAMEQEFGQLRQREQVREQQSTTDRLDTWFARQADALLGQGRAHELRPDSDEFQDRMSLIRRAEADSSPGTLEQKMDRAYKRFKERFGAKPPAEPEPTATRYSPEEYAAAGLARPTRRGGGPVQPKSHAETLRNISATLKGAGLGQNGISEEEAGLPD